MATDEEADEVFRIAELLAQHGKSNSSDIALRSAVSRGYYSVFLAAQRRSGYNGAHEPHGNVIHACAVPLGRMNKDKLMMMRELRTAADYFREAVHLPNTPDPHDLSDWNANWQYIELWAPRLRERLKTWKR